MSEKLTVRTTSGQLDLEKSRSLVGVKTSDDLSGVPMGDRVSIDLGGFEVVRLKKSGAAADAELDDIRQRPDVIVGTHVYFAKGDLRPVIPTGVIYCTLMSGVGPEESRKVFDSFHLNVLEEREDGTVVLEVTERSRNPLKVATALQQLAMVEAAVPDLDVPLDQYFSEPRDGLFAEQWSFDNVGSVPSAPNFPIKPGADARVRAAWGLLNSLGSAEVTIAIIDNGFDLEHPDLAGKAVAPLTIQSGAPSVPRGAAYGAHGTPCASLALASANGNGIVGAAPNSRLMPLHGLTYSSYYTERMFSHCVASGADIISCSWGTITDKFRPGSFHERAVREAATRGRGGKGCVILFAAGNEGADRLNYYSTLPGVIAVGASTSNDTHPNYSNRGAGLSVVAPSDGGWPVLAARASWDPGNTHLSPAKKYYVDGRDRGPYHKHFGGTSSATPLVAGICALILSANPSLTATEVKLILEETADKIGGSWEYDERGYSLKFGYGRVNAERAVAEALRSGRPAVAPAPPPKISTPAAFEVSADPVPTSGFGLQIGAYKNYPGVLQVTNELKQRTGLPVIVLTTGNSADPTYKVVVGNYPTADAARGKISDLNAMGYRPFVRKLE